MIEENENQIMMKTEGLSYITDSLNENILLKLKGRDITGWIPKQYLDDLLAMFIAGYTSGIKDSLWGNS